MNLHRGEWWTFAENTASLKLVGFRENGRLCEAVFFDNKFHDLVVLGILKNEYKPAKN